MQNSASGFEMKGNEHRKPNLCVSSLQELDALVGKHLTGERPRVHWLNTRMDFRFETIEEAVESVSDPFYSQLSQRNDPATTVLVEVREYRRYSSELTVVWELIEHHGHSLGPLRVRRDGRNWESAFGDRDYVRASTAPVAICLAALQARGVDVECRLPQPELRDAKINSLYSRA